jgi:predicted phosphoribosyltransferase
MPIYSPAFRFRDRDEAGKALGQKLAPQYANRQDVIVLALPRGGVPVAYEVAKILNAPLDVFLVRKLGVPGHEELAMGAIAQSFNTTPQPSGVVRVLNEEVVRSLNISEEILDAVTDVEAAELHRRLRQYRDDRPPPDVRGKIVILIDDGLATGSTMRAAATALRRQDPKAVVVAVPVAAASTCDEFRSFVDDIVCAFTPEPFYAVGQWYEEFDQTSDEEVRDLLARSATQSAGGASSSTETETGDHYAV